MIYGCCSAWGHKKKGFNLEAGGLHWAAGWREGSHGNYKYAALAQREGAVACLVWSKEKTSTALIVPIIELALSRFDELVASTACPSPAAAQCGAQWPWSTLSTLIQKAVSDARKGGLESGWGYMQGDADAVC